MISGYPWSAGCDESRTSGAEGGPENRTGSNPGTALRPDPYIIGSNTSQVATLVDRADKTVHLIGLQSRTAECLRTELTQHLDSLPQLSMQTLTWDWGMEMAEHQEIAKATGVGIYFADPHAPWQRGTNENTNGLIRQYLPKKTDLDRYSQDDLDEIAHQLNTRPRKSLNYQTPLETQHANVALTI